MLSLSAHARLRRSPLSRWLFALKDRVDDVRPAISRRESQSALSKRRSILRMLRAHGIKIVIESGTFLGDTTWFLSRYDYKVTTIEVHPQLAEFARVRFTKSENVRVIEGDSGTLMPVLVAELREPALFYLDGHYSGAGTGKGDRETPIVSEVKAILTYAPQNSLVVIDDARCFGKQPDYPPIKEFLEYIRTMGVHDATVEHDTIRFSITNSGGRSGMRTEPC